MRNKLKKLSILFVLISLGIAPVAQAQLFEIIGGYLINKAIAGGQKREIPAAAIYVNVYFREKDGSLTPLQGWNTASAVQATWNDDVVLEPVLVINGSNSPREVQWSIQDSRGPVRKIQYNPVSGGKRGKDGQAADNGGYKYDSPKIAVRDLPLGFFAISASAGTGVTATVVAQHMDSRDIMKMMDREDIKNVWAGAGTAMSPAMPVFLVRLPNGEVKPFMSQQELESAIALQNAKVAPVQPALPPPVEGQSVEAIEARSSSFDVRSVLYSIAGTAKGDPREILSNLSRAASEQNPEVSDVVSIPQGNGRAFLVTSPVKFTVEMVDSRDVVLKNFAVATFEVDGKTYYTVMVLLANDGKSPMTNKLVVRSDNERRVLTFGGGR